MHKLLAGFCNFGEERGERESGGEGGGRGGIERGREGGREREICRKLDFRASTKTRGEISKEDGRLLSTVFPCHPILSELSFSEPFSALTLSLLQFPRLLHIPSFLLHVLRFLQQTFLANERSHTKESRHQTFLLRHTQHSDTHAQTQNHGLRHELRRRTDTGTASANPINRNDLC